MLKKLCKKYFIPNEILIGDFLDVKEFWAVDMNYDLTLNILDIVRHVEFLLSP